MPNKNYINGRRFEYHIRDHWRGRGAIAFRSAGSHSPYDVIAITVQGEQVKQQVERNGVLYTTYTTPIMGYAIQCKRRKLPPKHAKQPRDHRQNT